MNQSFATFAEYAAYQGAPESAFIAAGWKPRPVMHYCSTHERERPALQFETKTGQRWRYIDGLKPKYASPTGYTRCLYHLPKAIAKAKQTGQPLAIVNGEAGQVVAFYHGIAATCVTSGEKSGIPSPLLDELKAGYPEGEISIIFDCDTPGRSAAAGLAQLLTLAGYTVRAIDLQLPNEGGDIANFCKANPVNTLAKLAALPDLPKAPEKRRYQPPVIVENTDTPPELIQANAAALNAPPPNASGFSRTNVTCPFSENHSHADKTKSASFNWKTGAIYCHTAGCESHSHQAVAERLGIDWRRFYPKPLRQPEQPAPVTRQNVTIISPASAPAPRSWYPTKGLPKWHGAAMRHLLGGYIFHYEAFHRAFRAGAICGTGFTLDAAVMALANDEAFTRCDVGQDEQSIRRAIQAGIGIYFHLLPIVKDNDSLLANSDNNSPHPGRPQEVYAIYTGEELNRRVYDALNRRFFKHHFKMALPDTLPPWLIADDEIGADNVPRLTGEKLKALNREFQTYASEIDYTARYRYLVEMHGNKYWQGWRKALQDMSEFEIEPAATPKQYRANALAAQLTAIDPNMPPTQTELARLCGCFERSINNLKELIGYETRPNQPTVTIERAEDEASITKQIRFAKGRYRAYVMHVNAGDVTIDKSDTGEMLRYLKAGHKLTVCLNAPPIYQKIDPDAPPRQKLQNTAKPAPEPTPDEAANEDEEAATMPPLLFVERLIWRLLERKGYTRAAAGHIVSKTDGSIVFYDPLLQDLVTVAAYAAPAWKRNQQERIS